MKEISSDPLNLNVRLYKQLDRLLDDMESADRDNLMTMPQRISALIAVARVQVLFNTIRKGAFDDGHAGSTVRKYAKAFAKSASTGGGKGNSRSANVVQFDSFGGDDDGDDSA